MMTLQSIKDWLLLSVSLVAILQATYTLGASSQHVAFESRPLQALEAPRTYRRIFHAALPETEVASREVSE